MTKKTVKRTKRWWQYQLHLEYVRLFYTNEISQKEFDEYIDGMNYVVENFINDEETMTFETFVKTIQVIMNDEKNKMLK